MARSIGMELILVERKFNRVVPNFIPPTLNTCIINSIEVVTVTNIKSANV